VTNNLPSKSLCLTDITNVSFAKSAETESTVHVLQRKMKPDLSPSNSTRPEDSSDVLSSRPNTSQHNSFTGLNSVTDSILNNESFRTTDFITNEQLRLANNASLYANENSYNTQNCSQTGGDVNLSALNNNTCAVAASINGRSVESNFGDMHSNHVDIDCKTVRASEELQQQQQAACIQSSAELCSDETVPCSEQTTFTYVDETNTVNRQPSVACVEETLPFIDEAVPDAVIEVQKQVNLMRFDHASGDKDHKTAGKRKG
jgi:hypothetical protein